MTGVPQAPNLCLVAGIEQCAFGKKVLAEHPRYTIQNECNGQSIFSILNNLHSLNLNYAVSSVTSSIYSADARFVLTGSDDGNVRIWKARASDKLGIITAREKAAMEYRDSLRERWKSDSEIGKVARLVFR